MTFEIKKLLGLGATLAVLTGGPALAQDLTEWDGDGDGAITEEEFGGGWDSSFGDKNWFTENDGDGDGMLSEDEFRSGMYRSYDADGNGVIEEPEFGDVGDDMGDGGFWDV